MSDVREVAQAHADLDPSDGIADEIDREFNEDEPLHELVARRVARNEPRSQIARALGLTIDEVSDLVQVAIQDRTRERGSISDQIFALHVALDEIVDDVYRALDADASRYDRTALLRIQLDAARLRTEFFAASRGADGR